MRRKTGLALALALGAALAGSAAAPGARAEGERGVAGAAEVLRTAADPLARAEAAAWLGAPPRRRDASAARALTTALADPDALVRRSAAAGLATAGGPARRIALEAAVARETSGETLPALLLALGAQGDPAALPALLSWRRHALPAVRAALLTALGDVGGEPSRRVLLEALQDPGGSDNGFGVRSAAVLALAKVGRRGDIGPVLACYREGGGWAWWLARSALAKAVPTIDPDPLPLLEHLVYDGDSRVAVTAAVGFVAAGAPERLLALLSHPGPGIRAAACAAVAQTGRREAQSALVRLSTSDAALGVRWSAALALFRLEAPEGDEAVLAGLGSGEAAIWGEALAALAERTGEQHGRDAGAWRAALQRWRRR